MIEHSYSKDSLTANNVGFYLSVFSRLVADQEGATISVGWVNAYSSGYSRHELENIYIIVDGKQVEDTWC